MTKQGMLAELSALLGWREVVSVYLDVLREKGTRWDVSLQDRDTFYDMHQVLRLFASERLGDVFFIEVTPTPTERRRLDEFMRLFGPELLAPPQPGAYLRMEACLLQTLLIL